MGLFFFILGNFGLPGTVNFVGELLIIFSVLFLKILFFFILFIGLLLTLGYSLFLYIRLSFGGLSIEFIRYYVDLTRREFILCCCFLLGTIMYGLWPQVLFKIFFYSTYLL